MPSYYITACINPLCAGGDEFLREADAKIAPCSWCGASTTYVEGEMDERARDRMYAKAEGLCFIQNQEGTILFGGEECP